MYSANKSSPANELFLVDSLKKGGASLGTKRNLPSPEPLNDKTILQQKCDVFSNKSSWHTSVFCPFVGYKGFIMVKQLVNNTESIVPPFTKCRVDGAFQSCE